MSEISQERAMFLFSVEPDRLKYAIPWQGTEGMNEAVTYCGHHKLMETTPGLQDFMAQTGTSFHDFCRTFIVSQPVLRGWSLEVAHVSSLENYKFIAMKMFH